MVVSCFALRPQVFFEQPHAGLSYYANYMPTAIPYALGFSLSVACLLFAVQSIPEYTLRLKRMRLALLGIAGCLAGILVTPNLANNFFYYAHMYITILLFATSSLTAIWVLLAMKRISTLDWVLFAMMVLGGLVSLLSAEYIQVLGLLPWAQVAALNGATLIIVRGVIQWVRELPQDNRAPY